MSGKLRKILDILARKLNVLFFNFKFIKMDNKGKLVYEITNDNLNEGVHHQDLKYIGIVKEETDTMYIVKFVNKKDAVLFNDKEEVLNYKAK